MKRIAFLFSITALFASSCSNLENFGPKDDNIVNSKIENAIAKAYPDAKTVNYVQVSPKEVEASLISKKDGLLVGVTTSGQITFEARSIENAQLPAVALDYLAANYPGYELIRAGEKKEKDGTVSKGFVANIKHNGMMLHIHFDAAGTFVSVSEKKGKHKGEGKTITAAELPAASTDYLKANFAGYTLVDARSFSKDGVLSGFGVRITTSDNKQVMVHFDATGAFLNSREGELGHGKGDDKGKGVGRGKDGTAHAKIEKSALPAAIISYLDSKYAGYVYKYAKSKSENGVLSQYEVEFTLNGKVYEVYFTAAGAFVKEKVRG